MTAAGLAPPAASGPAPGGPLDLWLLAVPAPGPWSADLALHELDAEERLRADRFRRPAGRLRYAAAHIALRRLLGDRLGTAAREVVLGRAGCPVCGGPHGRPLIAGDPPPPLHFSLSHSGGLVLIAVAAAPVGVDVEATARPSAVERCMPALHPCERAELERCPPAERTALFGRLWTRKEAYLKGVGTGLGHRGLSRAYLGDGGPGAPSRPPGWTVLDVPCPAGCPAAAAVLGGPPPAVTLRRLSLDTVLAGPTPPTIHRT